MRLRGDPAVATKGVMQFEKQERPKITFQHLDPTPNDLGLEALNIDLYVGRSQAGSLCKSVKGNGLDASALGLGMMVLGAT